MQGKNKENGYFSGEYRDAHQECSNRDYRGGQALVFDRNIDILGVG